jgi:hypothetical protein
VQLTGVGAPAAFPRTAASHASQAAALAVHETLLNVWLEVKHWSVPESNEGESVIEDRVSVLPSAFETRPLIGYVIEVWVALAVPASHCLVTLIPQVLNELKIKNLAAALPREEQGVDEHDGDEMLSNITLLKQGAWPEKRLFMSMPPLKNNPVASVVPVLGLDNAPGTVMLWSFTSPHSKLLPLPVHWPAATKLRLPLLSQAAPDPVHCHLKTWISAVPPPPVKADRRNKSPLAWWLLKPAVFAGGTIGLGLTALWKSHTPWSSSPLLLARVTR